MSPGLTSEQQIARAGFDRLLGRGRLRRVLDGEGWPIVPGQYGQIEWFNPDRLAVFTDRYRIATKLRAIPGVLAHQVGDEEFRGVFAPAVLPAVARIIGARRRRGSAVSPQSLANLRMGAISGRYKAPSASIAIAQDPGTGQSA